jgi:hypothetical protein
MRQSIDFLEDAADGFLVFCLRARLVQRHLAETAHRGQRRPQLV